MAKQLNDIIPESEHHYFKKQLTGKNLPDVISDRGRKNLKLETMESVRKTTEIFTRVQMSLHKQWWIQH